jgi:hypothetical protein
LLKPLPFLFNSSLSKENISDSDYQKNNDIEVKTEYNNFNKSSFQLIQMDKNVNSLLLYGPDDLEGEGDFSRLENLMYLYLENNGKTTKINLSNNKELTKFDLLNNSDLPLTINVGNNSKCLEINIFRN